MLKHLNILFSEYRKTVISIYFILLFLFSLSFFSISFNDNSAIHKQRILTQEDFAIILDILSNQKINTLQVTDSKNIKEAQQILDWLDIFNGQNSHQYFLHNVTRYASTKIIANLIPRSPPILLT